MQHLVIDYNNKKSEKRQFDCFGKYHYGPPGKSLIFLIVSIFFFSSMACAAQVTLRWNPNDPTPEGYRIYYHSQDQSFDYTSPAWSGSEVTHTFDNLEDDTTYHFVVRAFNGSKESTNSNEAIFTPEPKNRSPIADAGSDQTIDSNDVATLDGTRSNDPDNNFIQFQWLQISGPEVTLIEPTSAITTFTAPDAGTSEVILLFQLIVTDTEGLSGSDACQVRINSKALEDNNNEEQDSISPPINQINVEENNFSIKPRKRFATSITDTDALVPPLETDPFESLARDMTHVGIQWQIIKFSDQTIVFQVQTDINLATMTIPRFILNPATTYECRIRYVNNQDQTSEWSDPILFTSVTADNDMDDNGIPDNQQIDENLDLNHDGQPDGQQNDIIKCIGSLNGRHAIGISIEDSDTITWFESAAAIDPQDLDENPYSSEQMEFGLIGYKLNVGQPGQEASVKIYFTDPLPLNLKWAKYDTINGWSDYSSHMVINEGRHSVTIELRDGGFGDADGVANGIIVDPSGPVMMTDKNSAGFSSSSEGEEGGCFIYASFL